MLFSWRYQKSTKKRRAIVRRDALRFIISRCPIGSKNVPLSSPKHCLPSEAHYKLGRATHRRLNQSRIKAQEEGGCIHRDRGWPGASAKVSRDQAYEAWRRIAVSLAIRTRERFDSWPLRSLASSGTHHRGETSRRCNKVCNGCAIDRHRTAARGRRDRPSLGDLAVALKWNDRLGMQCESRPYGPVAGDAFDPNCLSQIAEGISEMQRFRPVTADLRTSAP